jgi:uncharacterized protein involved in exopolysaccharide biosynthesis
MADSPDVTQYMAHVWSRWRFVAAACAIAFALSLGASLWTPAQYTATARILIEPPATGSAMAVSPIYLEMLRSYEHFARSDNLFQRALEKFELRRERPGRSIESWKRAILHVETPRNTRILEIAVTLPDPRKAQAMAQFLAEETVRATRAVGDESELEAIAKMEAQVKALDDELNRMGIPADQRIVRRETPGLRRSGLEVAWDLVRQRLEEVRAASGARTERLRLVDRGIVPESPSSPKVRRNVFVAVVFAFAASLLYLTIRYAIDAQRRRD